MSSAPATTAAPNSLHSDSLAASVAILLTLTVAQRVIGFVRSMLFCRWLDADQLGQWDMAFGFLMLASPLALLGVPGSFGRYVEHYRQQGQLRTFLRRTAITSIVMGIVAVVVVIAQRTWFSQLIFGGNDKILLVTVVAGSLGSVIAFNFLISLFTSLRQYRTVSTMQMTNTVSFAVIAIALLSAFRPTAMSVILAFGLSCIITAVLGLSRLLPLWKSLPSTTAPLSHWTLWSKLAPFAFWLWMMNWIANVFEIVDRFMIVHYSGLSEVASLDLVGQYHSARVIPVLFIGVAEMFSGMITPHLTADWEAGRREVVSQRLNTIVKLFATALVIGSAMIIACAPVLFGTIFKHKFAGGLDILPWVLIACIWTSMNSLMNNYLWCAEKSHHLSLTLGAGLTLSILLNLALLPLLGLKGVAIASAASKALSLCLLWWICSKYDWRADRGLIIAALLPLLLPLGAVVTLATTAIVLAGMTPTMPFLRPDERTMIFSALRDNWHRLTQKVRRHRQPA